MYKVRLKLSNPRYKNVFLSGIFVPKESGRQKIATMKEKVVNYTMDKLKKANSLYSDFSCEIVEFKNLKTDFILNENDEVKE